MVLDQIPRRLYEHPIVEYIPIEVTTWTTGLLPPAGPEPAGVHPLLQPLLSPEFWASALDVCPFAFRPPFELAACRQALDARGHLALLALGFRVAAGIYRGRKISLVASTVGPVYHLFSFTLRYLYKPSIDVVAYDSLGLCLTATTGLKVGPRVRSAARPVTVRP